MKWFRLFTEARTDAKLRTLTVEQRWVWFSLLCFAAEQPERGTIAGYSQKLLAAEVAEGNADLLAATLVELVDLRIISITDDGAIHFVNFAKRQYDKPSDQPESTAERKRRQRERERQARDIPNKEESHASVTPGHATDTEADTDSETELAPATAARVPEPDVLEPTIAELEVARKIQQIRGMANVSEHTIISHLREILTIRGSPVSERAILADASRFRDHWNVKRANRPPGEHWKLWKKSMSNWFERTKEPGNGNRPNDLNGGRHPDPASQMGGDGDNAYTSGRFGHLVVKSAGG